LEWEREKGRRKKGEGKREKAIRNSVWPEKRN